MEIVSILCYIAGGMFILVIPPLRIWKEISNLKKDAEETKYQRTKENRENYVRKHKDEILRNSIKIKEEWKKNSRGIIRHFLYETFGGQEVWDYLREPLTQFELAEILDRQPSPEEPQKVDRKLSYKERLEINLRARTAEIISEMKLKTNIVRFQYYLMKALEEDRRKEEKIIRNDPNLTEDEKEENLKILNQTYSRGGDFLDEYNSQAKK